tara:strand:+ start:14 stop:193 length:180 start_codon:yes stop_codon:yes gene_type:complete
MENSNASKCYYCHTSLTETYWACYYSYEGDTSNMVCGEASCWADWIQDNMQEHTIGEDE